MIDYLRVARVDHWLKNVFIVFGHAVAIVLALDLEIDGGTVLRAFLSLVPACLIASANYILNEILDAPFDKLHPRKNVRPIPAGRVNVPILWGIMIACVVVGFALALWWFRNPGYWISLGLLLLSGLVYNVEPVRLKDRAFLDVIAESFNNPIRLWLGWFALVETRHFPPLSIMLAWWCFGGLLMTGKRYSEFRFIDDKELSGQYRKSFKVYTDRSLVIAMITYANLFCFCSGWAMASYPALNNLAFVFPLVVLAVVMYFRHAMSEIGARLEPEQLLQNKWIIVSTALTAVVAAALLYAHKAGLFNAKEILHSPGDYHAPSAAPESGRR
ncbi:MAG: UbiA family prenyltransferase [Verrucomicrobiae bacterium]|nr:UbiA family prenyltransferase [Verrucomicrobiae bacterium]MCP5540012.1 UbiA family prenyltransferase [Akkermansiaceae bacterium]MCP5549947.1 UbiA family prenyltransferase [Akkermansiaceae bacterium]